MSRGFNRVTSGKDSEAREHPQGRTEPKAGQAHAGAAHMQNGMDVTTPGIETFAAARLVTKTEWAFDVGFVHPGNIPMCGKLARLGVVVAAYAEDGNRTAQSPFFNRLMRRGRNAFRTMNEITEDKDAFGSRLSGNFCELIEIAIEHGAGNRNAGLLKDFRLAPMRIGKDQRFLFVPVDRFAPVEGELLSPYFC